MTDRKTDLTGKTIVVTGGSMGIGFACAQFALKAGARVAIAARNEQSLREAAIELRRFGNANDIAAIAADISKSADVDRLFSEAESSLGKLNGVIHAAAVLGPIGPVTDLDEAQWLETIRVNLFGTFLVVRKAAALFRTSSGGRIAAFAGGGASFSWPNYTAYACSKVAVVRFVETVAEELAGCVEINAIAPGFVVTRMQAQTLAAGDRAGAAYLQRARMEIDKGGVPPETAAGLAAFLVSDAALGITGKLVSAVHDGWQTWPDHLADLKQSDIFTLRRILPKERGMTWQ